VFNQKLYKVTSQFRGTTSSLLYAQALIKQAGYNELAPVTLMSTDVDRMTMSLTRVMELWAQFIEVSLGIWLLWRQVGAVAVAPLVITLICFLIQTWGSGFMGARQARYFSLVITD
jgi:ATP-binding cassette, subfamily C (CFTR/MRP), member 1